MRRTIRHIICGWHSGFRLCCVAWYVTVWEWAWRNKRWRFIRKYAAWTESRKGRRALYIECPLCRVFSRKPRRVFKCDCY